MTGDRRHRKTFQAIEQLLASDHDLFGVPATFQRGNLAQVAPDEESRLLGTAKNHEPGRRIVFQVGEQRLQFGEDLFREQVIGPPRHIQGRRHDARARRSVTRKFFNSERSMQHLRTALLQAFLTAKFESTLPRTQSLHSLAFYQNSCVKNSGQQQLRILAPDLSGFVRILARCCPARETVPQGMSGTFGVR